MEGSRPGVMLYFETLQAIEELEAEDAKQIMSAILHYSRDGELPALRGPLAAVWSLIQSGLDRDKVRYGDKQIRGIWLTYCRKCKSTGETPLGFDEWVSTQYDNGTLPYVERTVNRAVNVPSPTTSPSTTPTVSPAPSPTVSPTPTKEGIGGMGDAPSALTPTQGKKSRSHFVPPTLEEVEVYVRERGSRVDPQGFIDFYAAKGWMVGRNKIKDWKAACRNAEKWERWQRGGTRNEVKTASDYESGDDFFTR